MMQASSTKLRFGGRIIVTVDIYITVGNGLVCSVKYDEATVNMTHWIWLISHASQK